MGTLLPAIASPPVEASAPATSLPMRDRLIHARLLTLLILIRVSAELGYRRQLGLVELHRRLLGLIGDYGALTSVELVVLSGQEKAQISRAVKALCQAGLIDRASLRAPLGLSESGQAAFDAIIAVAQDRNAVLTAGIAAARLSRFLDVTARLTDRAALLLATERQLSAAAGSPADEERDEASGFIDRPPRPPVARGAEPERPMAQMITPPLITLTAYLQRSATIGYRRETDLSNFAWQVLSQVGEHEPITLARLIGIIGRDKSQVGRTVRRLEQAGIIERRKIRGRRDIELAPTPSGADVYRRMCIDALRRDDFLSAGCSVAEREDYIATIEALTANASLLLAGERERARERAA
jgi:DNA-binding MarR family transcriptional regulator